MSDTTPEQKPATQTPPATGECMIISEKQFMRDHTMYSAISSWLFAIAGATNIGILCALSSKVLTAAEQDKPLFKAKPGTEAVLGNKKYNRIAIGMTAFGAVCMGVSNWLESKKVVTEWQLGAGKLQRKANIAENELNHKASPNQIAAKDSGDAPAEQAQPKKWSDSVKPRSCDPIVNPANCFQH